MFSTADMLRLSREIEQALMIDPEEPLYVGVQHGHRLDEQVEVYTGLMDAGVTVIAFGVDERTSVGGVRWVQVPDEPAALAASWFLLLGGSNPHALVGFEVGEPIDGVRQWEGFESRDERLVQGVINHLHDLAGDQLADVGVTESTSR